eukprot:c24722_g1_i1 orf=107-1465(+)
MVLEVSTVCSKVVKPSIPPPYRFRKLHSSNLDLVIANLYVKTIHFFREGSHETCAELLAEALSQALTHFYPLAGRLTQDLDIVCNGAGALFVHARASCSLEEVGDLRPHPQLLKLVPSVDVSHDLTSRPLLSVQFTTFLCGGSSLGVGIDHHAADGLSVSSFLNAWADIARGDGYTGSPSFDRTCLKARSPPTPKFVHDEYIKLPQQLPKEKVVNLKIDALADEEVAEVRMLELSKEFLQMLKRMDVTGRLSTFELMAALVWKFSNKARDVESEEESMLVMPADGRARLKKPPLSQNYFGNAVFNCCPLLTAAEIQKASVVAIASKIHQSIERMDDEYCRSALDFLEVQKRWDLGRFVKGAHTFTSPNIGFVSWAKLGFDECDFGWGHPFHVGHVVLPFEGQAYLLPSSIPGCLNLCICLQRRHISAFCALLSHAQSLMTVGLDSNLMACYK